MFRIYRGHNFVAQETAALNARIKIIESCAITRHFAPPISINIICFYCLNSQMQIVLLY